jgi:hypothetical protein
MIRLLSAVGRATIVIAAGVIIAGGAIGGYVGSEARPELFFTIYGRWLGALIGFALGVVSAGVLLGPLATLYDIRDSLRRMASSDAAGAPLKPRAAGGGGASRARAPAAWS